MRFRIATAVTGATVAGSGAAMAAATGSVTGAPRRVRSLADLELLCFAHSFRFFEVRRALDSPRCPAPWRSLERCATHFACFALGCGWVGRFSASRLNAFNAGWTHVSSLPFRAQQSKHAKTCPSKVESREAVQHLDPLDAQADSSRSKYLKNGEKGL